MGVNIRNKGKSGEYEFIEKFGAFFTAFTDKPCERNLEQTRYGGSDITNVSPFCIEIKRVEDTGNGNKNSWWKQVSKAASSEEIEVVAFRPSRQPWKFLVPVRLIGVQLDNFMEIDEDTFVQLVMKTFQDTPLDT
jgi:hypothetical protein